MSISQCVWYGTGHRDAYIHPGGTMRDKIIKKPTWLVFAWVFSMPLNVTRGSWWVQLLFHRKAFDCQPLNCLVTTSVAKQPRLIDQRAYAIIISGLAHAELQDKYTGPSLWSCITDALHVELLLIHGQLHTSMSCCCVHICADGTLKCHPLLIYFPDQHVITSRDQDVTWSRSTLWAESTTVQSTIKRGHWVMTSQWRHMSYCPCSVTTSNVSHIDYRLPYDLQIG